MPNIFMIFKDKFQLRQSTFNRLLFGTLKEQMTPLVRYGVLLWGLLLQGAFFYHAYPFLKEGISLERLATLITSFTEDFFWFLVCLPFASAVLILLFFAAYFHAFVLVNRAHKDQIMTAKQDLKTAAQREKELAHKNHQMETEALALSKKKKQQKDLLEELHRRQQILCDKTCSIAHLLSQVASASETDLLPHQKENLLAEMNASSKFMGDQLFDITKKTCFSLSKCLRDSQQYLEWNFMKAGISFSLRVVEKAPFESDEFAFKMLLINLLLQHVERAYEGATLSCLVIQTAHQLDIHIDCTDAIKASTPSDFSLASDPLAFPKESLPKLAETLGFHYQLSKGIVTSLILAPCTSGNESPDHSLLH